MSLPRQVPINGTYQKRILPGNQTNLYYILLSNLPWQTSWQQLKDHVRQVCQVERVEVFNESTTGWVSVRGRENFDAAFDLLNGGIFNGRALFADGKNATDAIMIKEPIEIPGAQQHTAKTSRTRRSSTPLVYYSEAAPAVVPPDQWVYGSSASHAVLPLPADYLLHSGAAYGYNSIPRYRPAVVENSVRSHGAAAVCQPRVPTYIHDTYFDAPRGARPESYSKPTRSSNHANGSRESSLHATRGPRSEPVKVHRVLIRHIAPHVTYGELQDLVWHKIGSDAENIVQLDLPISENYDSNRGFALVTFYSETSASRAVRKLQGTKFEHRVLKVELNRDARHEDDGCRPAPSRKPHKDEKEKREKKSGASTSSESSKKTRCQPKSGVIIANGSSSSRKLCHGK